MKIAIVGWGVEGQSAYSFFGAEHEYLIVNEEPRDDFPPQSDKLRIQYIDSSRTPGLTGNVKDLSYLNGIDKYDQIVYSVTSLPNLKQAFGGNKDFWRKTTTVNHIFFEEAKTKNIIGVTGTKGKGTTSTLIAKMLETAGKKVYLGGNIGLGVLDFIKDLQPDDWVVLELSSFQLYDFPYSPHIAVCLMITPEHMDWHDGMEDYLRAKSNIFSHQEKDDIAIYFAGNAHSEQIVGYSPGIKIPYMVSPGARVVEDKTIAIGEPAKPIIDVNQLRLIGKHNRENVCAAVTAVWQVSQNVAAIHQVLSTFAGLEHRLEFVREVDRVRYFDDSFGTTPDTAIVAMQAIMQPEVLILGGSDKGASIEKLVKEISSKERIRHIITIGQTGPTIAKALREKGVTDITEGLTTMPEIVALAHSKAEPGDAVLLSPGFASFGMFKDYKDRGNQFKAAVQALA